ncbi:uncharacterized protein VTP21DRAFT_4381 [Calcarisporiella thermophila]|uniref:uncharacterized protein n=1 Tax=Calcarisporiella thermophila TaxID=911321 RepID=UPI0037433232
MSLTLRIAVVRGRNLVAKDKNGFSDPYVVVQIEKTLHQTQVLYKTLNPEWEDVFDIKLNSKQLQGGIQFTIWDKDRFGRDYMGEVFVPWEKTLDVAHPSFEDKENEPRWFPVVSRKKSQNVTGEILLKFGLIDVYNEVSPEEMGKLWEGLLQKTETLSLESGKSTPVDSISNNDVDKASGKRSPQSSEDSTVDLGTFGDGKYGTMFLEITSASDLPPIKNATKTSFDMDPFVIASIGQRTFRTRVISHSLNPVWKESLYFHVRESELNYTVRFSLYDWDKISGNDFIAYKDMKVHEIIELGRDRHPNGVEPAKGIESQLDWKTVPLNLLKEKYKDRCKPTLTFRARFLTYSEIRRHFWLALTRSYDTDENGVMNRTELIAMLDSLGSTLHSDTVDQFFARYGLDSQDPNAELTFDQVVECLEEQLVKNARDLPPPSEDTGNVSPGDEELVENEEELESEVERVVRVKECPVCQKPRINEGSELDIITHIAICSSNDWVKAADRFIMGNFVTEAQAQRKWLVKTVSRLGFGNYKIGGNNANIIVQDRATGHLVEEKMAIYVRFGMRLLYKGMKTGVESRTARKLLKSLSIKQGVKYNDPKSAAEIPHFIRFHNLDTTEILEPLESFKNFNEFFYRKLKPDARPCDSPDDPRVAVSAADSRMVCFETIDDATRVWIKGMEFSVARLLGDEEMAKEFEGGSLVIFRLAPQDYHRFHSPVDGTISSFRRIEGNYYTVNPMAIRSTLDVYGENTRAIGTIDSPTFGKVAMACIGAMMVGSVIITAKPGSEIKRTDEVGYFAFGGSTIVTIFKKGAIKFDADLLERTRMPMETLIRVGNQIGVCPR